MFKNNAIIHFSLRWAFSKWQLTRGSMDKYQSKICLMYPSSFPPQMVVENWLNLNYEVIRGPTPGTKSQTLEVI